MAATPSGTSQIRAPSHSGVLRMAWPIMLANAAVPLLGIADTAVIGNTSGVTDLGAIALGSLIFSFVYWGFGFLRMGTTGFVARASGAEDGLEVRAAFGRALVLGAILGFALLLFQRPIIGSALTLLSASDAVEGVAESYFLVRIWGAPASLCMFAAMGCLVGLGESKRLLAVQLFLNGLNIALDVWFAGVLGWGVWGIALGTVVAEWVSLVFALLIIGQLLMAERGVGEPLWPWSRIRDAAKLRMTLSANADIMIRTLLLISSFTLFTNQAAIFGDDVLGANHILMQLISFSAYWLDAYAFVAESVIGRAIGARRRDVFDLAVLRSTQLAAGTAAVLALAVWLLGEMIIAGLTQHESIRAIANDYLPFAAMYVLLSFAAFQLDGIFIGASRTRAMRNASALSMGAFVVIWWLLGGYGYTGLWLAFISYVVARAISLCLFYPGLRRSIPSGTA